MNRSKKIFAALALLFFLLLMYIVYDISTRTTFPGARTPETERPGPDDSVRGDSLPSDTIPD